MTDYMFLKVYDSSCYEEDTGGISDNILLETGDNLLLETGDLILLE